MLLPTLLAFGGVAANRALLALRLRERRDGWRRAAALLLRGECSSFVLSAFGLNAWPASNPTQTPAETRAHVADRLAAFLAGEPATYVAIEHGAVEDFARPTSGPSFTLAFEPWIEGPQRFAVPSQWPAPPAGSDKPAVSPLLNIVVRMDAAGRADVWFRINHVGADGVPMQEVLSRLEAAWGAREQVAFPDPETFAPPVRPLSDRPGLSEVQAFLDFGPLLQWRKRQNALLREPMTLSAAVLWCLSRHRAFGELAFGTTVEVEACGGLKRGVGVVVVQPGDYQHRQDGVSRFVRALNRGIELTRRRASGTCKTLDAAALIGPAPAKALLRHALENSPRAFGTIALTMLKDARVFGAPIAETGHVRGFIAIGSVALPTAGGGRVGCVTIKGPTKLVTEYPEFMRQAISDCAALEPGV